MAGNVCPRCGRPLHPGGLYCPFCGAPGSTAASIPSATKTVSETRTVALLPPSTYDTAGGVSGRIRPTTSSRPLDRVALGRVVLAGLLALGNSIAVAVALAANPLLTALISDAFSPSGALASDAVFGVLSALLVGGAVLGVAEILTFRSAFRGLTYFDPKFSTPSKLTFLFFLGSLVVLLAGLVLLGTFYGAVQCAGTGGSVPTRCVEQSGYYLGLALSGIGSLVSLVGCLGMLLGIWRLGSRYRTVLFRAGALFLIIPFVGIAGAALITFGAWRRRRSLDRGAFR